MSTLVCLKKAPGSGRQPLLRGFSPILSLSPDGIDVGLDLVLRQVIHQEAAYKAAPCKSGIDLADLDDPALVVKAWVPPECREHK